MYAGDIISGKTGETYLLLKPLGTPGLFGQAFLCRRASDNIEAVLKTLRSEHSADEQNRFFQEARTLEKVARVEDRAGVHYAVRLLDESAADQSEPFIVLERATGLNVVEDLISPVQDWLHAPLNEQLALSIAWEFAQALQYVHQAGICYDDMKLDNLFWNTDVPASPLRIIDWNVTSTVAERGVAGDWARFGARLYELRTGQGIGVTRDGLVLGQGPGGPVWQRLPEGMRVIIEQALSGRYVDDAILLRDLLREKEQSLLNWLELLDRATSADGAEYVIDVLAPVSRAEQQLCLLPTDDPQRAPYLARCAELRERAEVRRGRTSTKILERGRQSLAGNEARLAVERFQKAYADTRSLDPRPRRWLWLAQLAVEQADVYRLVRKDLEQAVEALDSENLRGALKGLTLAQRAAPDLALIQWLRAEAEVVKAQAANDLDTALEWAASWNGLVEQYPDLKRLLAMLREQRDVQIKRQTADEREQHLLQEVERQAAQASAAETSLRQLQQQHAERRAQQPLRLLNPADHDLALAQIERELQQHTLAIRYYTAALQNLAQMLTYGCTPSVRDLAEQKRTTYAAARHNLQQQQEALHVYSTAIMLARHPDLRERQKAVTAYAAAQRAMPDLALDMLATLPEQYAASAQDVQTIVLAEQATLLADVEAALQAVRRLEQVGVQQIDDTGMPLPQRLAQLRERQLELRNRDVDGHVQQRIDEAGHLLAVAQAMLDVEMCDAALAVLQSSTVQEVEPQLSPTLAAGLTTARRTVVELQQTLAEIAVGRHQIEQFKADDLNRACQLSQRLSARYPTITLLADEHMQMEAALYEQFAAAVIKIIDPAEALRQSIERTPQRYSRRLAIVDLRQQARALVQHRHALDSFSALPAARRQPMLEQADGLLAAVHSSLAAWEQAYTQYQEQLAHGLSRSIHTLQHGRPASARQLLMELQPLLPPATEPTDLDALVARFHALVGQLDIWDALYQQIEDWETALLTEPPQIRYPELVALAESDNPFRPYLLDPDQDEYLDRRFTTVRERAAKLLLELAQALKSAQQAQAPDRTQAALSWILARTPDYPDAAALQEALAAHAQRQEATRYLNEIRWALTNNTQDDLPAMIERLGQIDPAAAESACEQIASWYQEQAALLLDRDDLDASGLATAHSWIVAARSFSPLGLENALKQYHAADTLLAVRDVLSQARPGEWHGWTNLERQIQYATKCAREYGPDSNLAVAAVGLHARWRRAYAGHWLAMAEQHLIRHEYIDAAECVQEANKLQVLQQADRIQHLEAEIQARMSQRARLKIEVRTHLDELPTFLATSLEQAHPKLLRCLDLEAQYLQGDPLCQELSDLCSRYATIWRDSAPDSNDTAQWWQYLARGRGLPQLDAEVRVLSRKIEAQEVYEQSDQLINEVLGQLSRVSVEQASTPDPLILHHGRWRLEAAGAQQDQQGQLLLDRLASLAVLCERLARLEWLFDMDHASFTHGCDEAAEALSQVGVAEICEPVSHYLEESRKYHLLAQGLTPTSEIDQPALSVR